MAKIVLKGATNVREFGGIENSVGREILYKKFMRGSELSKLTKEDRIKEASELIKNNL